MNKTADDLNNGKAKVLFIWDVNKRLKDHIFEKLKDTRLDLIFPEPADEESFLQYASEVDAIVGWKPGKKLLERAQNLKLFINPGAGVRHLVDLFDTGSNVVITNSHGNAYFTAQHAIAMLLTITNKIIPHHRWTIEGKWRTGEKEGKSIPLKNLKVGLLGYGHINRYVHEFLKPFRTEVIILKRTIDNLNESDKTVYYSQDRLEEFLERSDAIITSLPETSETRSMIGSKELEKLGSNGIVINVGRGAVVEEEALYKALKSDKIAFAGIDVWYDYDCKKDSQGKRYPYKFPFHELENVLFSPHRAASPLDDLGRWDDVIYNLKVLANGKDNFVNVVDLQAGY